MLSDRQFGELANRVQNPGTGATVNVNTGDEPESGWMQAVKGHEERPLTRQVTGASIRGYVDRHHDALEKHGGNMGLWSSRGRVAHDVTVVRPNTYAGGLHSILGGYAHGQDAIFNRDRFETVHMEPTSRRTKAETRRGMKSLAAQRPEPAGEISSMPTEELRSALRNRKSV